MEYSDLSIAIQIRTLAAIRRVARAEAESAAAPRAPEVIVTPSSDAPVINDVQLTLRLANRLKEVLGEANVVEMPPKMTAEDFAEYGRAGVRSTLLHIGAVDPVRLKVARQTGIPVPAPHSPEWAPDRETTLKAAVRAEVTALAELLRGN